jgi:hypothetical protein
MIREVKTFRTKYEGYPIKEDIQNCINIAKRDDIFVRLEYSFKLKVGDRTYKITYDHIDVDNNSDIEDFRKIYERSDMNC